MNAPSLDDISEIAIVTCHGSDVDMNELMAQYSFATSHRDKFVRGEIPLDEYIDGLAENGMCVDEYLDICIDNFQEAGIIH